VFKKIRYLMIFTIIISILVIVFNNYNSFYNGKQPTTTNYVGMINGIEKNSVRIEKGNYYARIYHESNFPDIQEYNIICIYNNNQIAFNLEGRKKFVHNIKCQAYSKNYYDVKVENIKSGENDFLFLFIRDPYKHYNELIMPKKLNIASRSILNKEQNSLPIENLNIVPVETKNIYPGLWILDDLSSQYLKPCINVDINKNKILSLAYKGKSNKNICLIPIINYRQTHIKVNDKIFSYIKLPYIQKDSGCLINFEFPDKLTDNSIFFIIAIDESVNSNLAESVLVSNRTTIQVR